MKCQYQTLKRIYHPGDKNWFIDREYVECGIKASYMWVNASGKTMYFCKTHKYSYDRLSKRFNMNPPKLIPKCNKGGVR